MVPFRELSAVLAIVGGLWGLICLLLIFVNPIGSLPIFGPGYLVTAGYAWRAISPPRNLGRRIIWGASTVVQGSWFFWRASVLSEQGGGISGLLDLLATAWWVLSFAISVFGFFADQEASQA